MCGLEVESMEKKKEDWCRTRHVFNTNHKTNLKTKPITLTNPKPKRREKMNNKRTSYQYDRWKQCPELT